MTFLVASIDTFEQLHVITADNPERAVHAFCDGHSHGNRVLVIHGDSATVYAVNEIKSLSVVRLGGV